MNDITRTSKELCEHDWVGDDFCAYCDADAARDMLTDARLELDALRSALGVDYEPHQSLHERMLDAANHKRVERGVQGPCPNCGAKWASVELSSTHEPPVLLNDEFIGWTCKCGFVNLERNDPTCCGCEQRRPHQPASSQPPAAEPGIITAQHGETGRMWRGPRSCTPDGYHEVPSLTGHAAWQRERMAKWIAKNKPDLPDHACAQCMPGGDIVVEDFECVYHMALKIAESTPTKRAARDPRCDCQNPEPAKGPAMRSMTCPVHNDLPPATPDPDCTACKGTGEILSGAVHMGMSEKIACDCYSPEGEEVR